MQWQAQHLTLPSPSVLPVLAVRSCNLPREHTAAAVQHYAADHCKFRGECMSKEMCSWAYTEEEHRWRHAQHMLCGCADALYAPRSEGFFRCFPTLLTRRRDLMAAFLAPQAAAVRAALTCEVTCPTAVHTQLMPLILDPERFTGAEVPALVLSFSCRHVAAYIVRGGANIARVAPDPSRLESLRLPPTSQMAQDTTHGAVELGSDYEAWLCNDPPSASLPPALQPPHPPAGTRLWRDSRLALYFYAPPQAPRLSKSLRTTNACCKHASFLHPQNLRNLQSPPSSRTVQPRKSRMSSSSRCFACFDAHRASSTLVSVVSRACSIRASHVWHRFPNGGALT